MSTLNPKAGRQRGWVIGLALLSLLVPIATIVPFRVVTFAEPASRNAYGPTVAALVVGIVCAVGAIVAARARIPAGLRWTTVILASLGLLANAYVLSALIGTCGLQVLWATCHP